MEDNVKIKSESEKLYNDKQKQTINNIKIMAMDIKTGTGDMKDYRLKVGYQFYLIRQTQGWSVEQVAEMADVKPSTVEKIEAGAFNVPLDVLAKVADVLGCELTIKEK